MFTLEATHILEKTTHLTDINFSSDQIGEDFIAKANQRAVEMYQYEIKGKRIIKGKQVKMGSTTKPMQFCYTKIFV